MNRKTAFPYIHSSELSYEETVDRYGSKGGITSVTALNDIMSYFYRKARRKARERAIAEISKVMGNKRLTTAEKDILREKIRNKFVEDCK